jgi:hypothetical protein
MSIKNEALNRAFKLLEAIGCEYKIKFEGVFYGGLVLDSVGVKIRKKRIKRNTDPQYFAMKNTTSKMAVGATVNFVCKIGEGERIRSNLTCYIGKIWGKGNYVTSLKHHSGNDEVIIFRVG